MGVIAAKRDSFRDLTHTQKMYEYVAMHKPVVIAETSAVRTHFDDSCFEFFTSDDPVDLARALRDPHNPSRSLEMVELSSRRYRGYAWEAQRHVYCDAVLGTAPQHPQAATRRTRVIPQERVPGGQYGRPGARGGGSDPHGTSIDLSGMVASEIGSGNSSMVVYT